MNTNIQIQYTRHQKTAMQSHANGTEKQNTKYVVMTSSEDGDANARKRDGEAK